MKKIIVLVIFIFLSSFIEVIINSFTGARLEGAFGAKILYIVISRLIGSGLLYIYWMNL